MTNPYEVLKCTVENIITESPTIKTFVLKPERDFAFKTGEFVQFTVFGSGEAPFTPSSSPYISDMLDITIMKTGRVTSRIHNLKKGDLIGIRGPLGSGYPTEKFEGREILILGGGVGLAPLRSLILHLLGVREKYKRIILMYGSRTPDDIIYKEQFEDWAKQGVEIYRTVDKGTDGWTEDVGVVTTLFSKTEVDMKNGIAVVCGPPIMMKFGTLKLLEVGYKEESIYLSMEKNMSCGIGKCGHCALGRYFVCKDGPVFTYDKIKDITGIWD